MVLRANEPPIIPLKVRRNGKNSSIGGVASKRVNIHWPAFAMSTQLANKTLNIGIKVAMKLKGAAFSKVTD